MLHRCRRPNGHWEMMPFRPTLVAAARLAVSRLQPSQRIPTQANYGSPSSSCSSMLAMPLFSDHKRSEEHTSELQSLMRISYAVFCLKKKKGHTTNKTHNNTHVIYHYSTHNYNKQCTT